MLDLKYFWVCNIITCWYLSPANVSAAIAYVKSLILLSQSELFLYFISSTSSTYLDRRSMSELVEEMPCRQMGTRHFLNQCWLVILRIPKHNLNLSKTNIFDFSVSGEGELRSWPGLCAGESSAGSPGGRGQYPPSLGQRCGSGRGKQGHPATLLRHHRPLRTVSTGEQAMLTCWAVHFFIIM